MDTQSTFYRFEKKYLLSQFTYRRLQNLLAGHLVQDAYGLYTISSIYFDTDAYDIIRTSVQKPLFKEKLRLRWYGEPGQQSPMFWELKRKYHGKVYKRRIPAKPDAAARLLQATGAQHGDNQISREVDWFVRRYQPAPKLLLAYDREAFTCPAASDLRVTFDHNIRWRDHDFGLASGSYGTRLFEDDRVLMEVKACGNVPKWLSGLLAKEKIYPSSFSKYGTWYEQVYLQKGSKQYVG
ncbi:MAG TPA: polyphosphate polymerase domain-containing protein [Candidatus Limiplasma sp.]|nr:polyphosphate polymerase domain-containing protein [Candidatus Limiplasma sp.]HRX08457.1 polyphosphate polymerase domain-containing protein [Candidatus Limiplasma sp.]